MAGWTEPLRSGAWLTRERMRLLALAMLAATLLGALYLIATSDGRNDRFGRPLGTDFSNVYAAGSYVLDGEPSAPFDPIRQYTREQAIFGAATPFYGWHYPPFFLLLTAPLATMPYWLALVVWQGVTLIFYLLSIRGILDACAPSPRVHGEGQGEEFKSASLMVKGTVSRREGTMNVVVSRIKPFRVMDKAPQSKNWG